MTNMELLRRNAKLSQRALGELARVDAGYICTAEKYGFAHGVRLERIATALGWSGKPEELLEQVDVEKVVA